MRIQYILTNGYEKLFKSTLLNILINIIIRELAPK